MAEAPFLVFDLVSDGEPGTRPSTAAYMPPAARAAARDSAQRLGAGRLEVLASTPESVGAAPGKFGVVYVYKHEATVEVRWERETTSISYSTAAATEEARQDVEVCTEESLIGPGSRAGKPGRKVAVGPTASPGCYVEMRGVGTMNWLMWVDDDRRYLLVDEPAARSFDELVAISNLGLVDLVRN